MAVKSLRALRSRLSFRLALSAAAIALTIGGVLTGVQIYVDMQSERARINDLGAKLLRPLEASLERAAFRLDEAAALDLLTGLLQERAVVRAVIEDDFGDVLVELTQSQDRSALQNLGRVFGSAPIVTERPLVMDELEMRVGKVALHVDPIVASTEFSKRTALVLAAGLLKSFLLSLVLSLYFMRSTSSRIERLSRNYAPAVPAPEGEDADEIDTLEAVLKQWDQEKTGLIAALDLSVERAKLATSAARLGIWDLDLATGTMNWDDTMHAL